jgi:hypothetical protein
VPPADEKITLRAEIERPVAQKLDSSRPFASGFVKKSYERRRIGTEDALSDGAAGVTSSPSTPLLRETIKVSGVTASSIRV